MSNTGLCGAAQVQRLFLVVDLEPAALITDLSDCGLSFPLA